MRNRLENTVVVITGGNGLLGKAITESLICEGAFCINFDINHKTNDDLSLVNCDITNKESIDRALELVFAMYPKIDGLVNNAYPRTSDWGTKFEDIELESWKKNVDWQLNSHFYIIQKFAIHMAKKGSGSIVNMASIYGIIGPDFSIYNNTTMTMPAAYSAIKGALINFTKYLASYFGPNQVRVNAISPGGIFDNQSSVFVDNYCKKVPLRRMGKPDDVSPAVVFLLSKESSYITGQNIIIDGGLVSI